MSILLRDKSGLTRQIRREGRVRMRDVQEGVTNGNNGRRDASSRRWLSTSQDVIIVCLPECFLHWFLEWECCVKIITLLFPSPFCWCRLVRMEVGGRGFKSPPPPFGSDYLFISFYLFILCFLFYFFLLVKEVGDVRCIPLLHVWKIDPNIYHGMHAMLKPSPWKNPVNTTVWMTTIFYSVLHF